jgi:SAM-dependent methyltransferase
MPRFAQRVLVPELMDTEPCGSDTFRACLVDLSKVNRLSLAYRPTLAFLRQAARRLPPGRPLRLLDVGGGYGDTLRHLDRWAARRGIALDMTSVDLSPWSRTAGETAAATRTPIRFVTANIFDHVPDAPPDVVISSLFTHHLEDRDVVRFLRWMERHATLGWFVNDLHRHPVPYWFFRYFSQAMRWHRFVRHDGPVSIGRAFTRQDWQRMLAEAGLRASDATIRWWMPFRYGITRFKPGPAA